MRVGLLTAWANRANGGVFEAVAMHAAMLRGKGLSPHVFALAHPDDEADRPRFGDVPVTVCPLAGPQALGFAPGLRGALNAAELDLVHLHGIWTHVSADGASWARTTARPYVISPHGMLDPWILGRGRAKKAIATVWFEKANWRAASCFHALTGAEADDIARATGCKAVEVIPNGIALPDTVGQPTSPRIIVSLGRVHPKKNLLALVEGWRMSSAGLTGSRLIIAGWGAESDVADLRGAVAGLDGVEYVGPIFGEAKDKLLRQASFVILPSLSEGLPMAILEAWALGVPTIMTDASHLPEGFAAGAALRIGMSALQIAEGLTRALALRPDEQMAMAAAAKQLASDAFAADVIAERWVGLYQRLADGGKRAAA